MDTSGEGGIQALGQSLGHYKFPRDLFELHIALQCLHKANISTGLHVPPSVQTVQTNLEQFP